jgi:type I restriction enzyme, S subunit
MSGYKNIALKEIMASKLGSIDPSKFKQEIFDLYSIPVFDSGKPEVISGSEIGSTKQIVQPDDVLLSKIVPHIRRTWIVGKDNGRRIIASGEWIVFRSKLIEPRYLRHVLVSDLFHAHFMQTVSGVGGSLLRARPAQVASIEVPLPPIAEQKRIAEILDRTQSLISKRKEAIAKLDTLTQSIFLEMFGDPVANPKKWEVINMSECAERIQIGPFGTQLHEEDYIDNGIPLINPTHIKDGKIFPNSAFSISSEKHQELSQYHLEIDDVILGRRGEMGRCAIISENENGWLCGTGSLFIRPKHELLNSFYLFCVLSSQSIKKYLEKASQGVTMANLNKTIVSQIPMTVPPLVLQKEFAQRVEAVEKLKATHLASLRQLEALFASLQHRAFRGEL